MYSPPGWYQRPIPVSYTHLDVYKRQDLFIEMAPLTTQPAVVPRIFLAVAILFLVGMLASLLALRRDMGKRQQVQAMLQAQVALRTAMESSVTIGLRAWTRNGQILYVNCLLYTSRCV